MSIELTAADAAERARRMAAAADDEADVWELSRIADWLDHQESGGRDSRHWVRMLWLELERAEAQYTGVQDSLVLFQTALTTGIDLQEPGMTIPLLEKHVKALEAYIEVIRERLAAVSSEPGQKSEPPVSGFGPFSGEDEEEEEIPF